MTNGPTGPQYPDFELIQGEAFYVQRSAAPVQSGPVPFVACECSACQIRKLQAQIDTLTQERDAARAEHEQWLRDAWQRGVSQSATVKQQTYG